MWMNLDQLPAGHHMYTAYISLDPEGTSRDDTCADEVDIVAPARVDWEDVIKKGKAHPRGEDAQEYIDDMYGPKARVVGIVDQSSDYVLYDSWSNR